MIARPRTQRRWQIAEAAPRSYLASLPDLPPLLAQVLYNRGLHEPDAARAFLDGRWAEGDPFQLKGMATAVEAIQRAIRDRQRIAIYGDYDTDGVSAAALLVQALRTIGATGLGQTHIPHRYDEGYGVQAPALRKLAAEGVKLVVTVDCGISSAREVAEAAERGLGVIITDHHSPGPDMPDAAVAIINPRQPGCSYPFKDLAGVGLAYKLALALLGEHRPLDSDEFTDLVALGTVADIVSLQGENRTLVQRGLGRLRRAPSPGLQALLDVAGISPERVNARVISHMLGPRLNASGRLAYAHAQASLRLLLAESPAEARPLAQQLNAWNRERQRLTAQYTEAARRQALEIGDSPLLFIAQREFLSGVVGLVASRLLDEFYRPTVVVSITDDESRGSARSIPGFHIAEALNACHDLLERHGGHAAAAGFTIRTERLPALKERLQALAAEQLAGTDLARPVLIDAEARLPDLTESLAEGLARLEPCGHDNPAPLFLTRGLQIRQRHYVGREEAHLRLLLSDGQTERSAVAFNHAQLADHFPEYVDVVYNLDLNEWRGERRVEMHIRDLSPVEKGER